jgi:hypothetical protein
MANVYAVKSGNWSDNTVWNTGTLPTSADDVFSNNFTVTIDQNVTVLTLRNTAATGVNAGGVFTVTGNYTVVSGRLFRSATLITYNGTGTFEITTLIDGGSEGTGAYLNITGSGNVNFVGSITFNADGPRQAIVKSGIGILSITGDITATYINNNTVVNITNGDCYITGNITLGTGNTGTANFTSNVISYTAISTLEITGNIINESQRLNGTLETNIILSTSNSLIRHIGGMIMNNGLDGFCIKHTVGINLFSGPFVCSKYGFCPFLVYRMNLIITLNTYFEFRDSSTNGALAPSAPAPTTRFLSPDTLGDSPVPTNVRDGVSYALGTLTGTLKVPSPDSVAKGVPTDNTVGNAVLTPDAVWNYATANLTDANSIGARLKNVSTLETTGEQLEALL